MNRQRGRYSDDKLLMTQPAASLPLFDHVSEKAIMKVKSALIVLTLSIPLYFSTNSYAIELQKELPEACFKNHELYQNYIEAKTEAEADGSYGGAFSSYYMTLREENLAPIHIDVKQHQPSSGAEISLDASGSRVPGGKIGYRWGTQNTAGNTGPKKTLSAGSPGGYSVISITILDGVCGHEAASKITVTSK